MTRKALLARLLLAKEEQRKKDAQLAFAEKVDLVFALREVSRALVDAAEKKRL